VDKVYPIERMFYRTYVLFTLEFVALVDATRLIISRNYHARGLLLVYDRTMSGNTAGHYLRG
jgi:hypothetical protein